MKRWLLLLVVLAAAAACTRSGRPVVGQALEQTGKEYVDPYYFRNKPMGWKVIWFIGPGH
jgi:hypothetical protein